MGYTQKIKSGSYRARWQEPGGEWRSNSFESERAAKAHLTKVEGDLAYGAYISDRDGKTPFAKFAEEYFAMARRRLARTSNARDKSYLDNHVLPRWGKRGLASITKPEVERWVAELGDPGRSLRGEATLAPATVASERAPLARSPSRQFMTGVGLADARCLAHLLNETPRGWPLRAAKPHELRGRAVALSTVCRVFALRPGRRSGTPLAYYSDDGATRLPGTRTTTENRSLSPGFGPCSLATHALSRMLAAPVGFSVRSSTTSIPRVTSVDS